MTIETLAKQGQETQHKGLASVETTKLKQMRNAGLRSCFARLEEMHYRREFVAKIHGKTFVNDAAARSSNATWYTLESAEGSLIWIANGGGHSEEYEIIKNSAQQKVRALYCIGGNSGALHKAFDGIIPDIEEVDSIRTAVNKALYSDIEDATVIFSPAQENGLPMEVQGTEFMYEVNEL